MNELVLWGLSNGQTDPIHQTILSTQCRTEADIEKVKALAVKDGWHSFRVQVIDGSKPNFVAAITGCHAVELQRRPPSSSCPKGAWFSAHFHTSWANGGWTVWKTGVKEIACYRKVSEAKERMAKEELGLGPMFPPATA